MNDLDLLRSLGSDLEPTDGVPPARLRHSVLTRLTNEQSNNRFAERFSVSGHGPSRVRRNTAWGLTAVATVAAVTLVVTGGTNPPGGTNSPSDGGPAAAGAPGKASLNGSQVLLTAAEHAGAASTVTGKYWRMTIEVGQLRLADAKGNSFKLSSGLLQDIWTARSDNDSGRTLGKRLADTPATDQDRAIWKRAGSPAKVDIHYLDQDGKDGVMGGAPIGVSETGVRRQAPRASLKSAEDIEDGSAFTISQKPMSFKQVRNLPSDQAALRKVLLNNFERTVKDQQGKNVAPASIDGWTEDRWLFSNAVDILTVPTTPAVKASVYRILAGLDSVRNLGRVTDAKGRAGNGVALQWKGPSGVQQERLVIDTGTGALLAQEKRLLKPIKAMSWLKPTDVVNSTVVTRAGWTDATPPAPTRPEPESAGTGDGLG
jgi:hypothetical protein